MKILQMVTSCHRDRHNGAQQICRDTWAGQWGHLCDVRFFLGDGNFDPMPDEVIFPVPDNFNHVVEKEHLAFQWALDQGYDYAYLSSPDCYRILPAMLRSEFAKYEYYGSQVLHQFYAGGCGFWLSKKALEVLATSPVWWDFPDKAVGYVLAKANIWLKDDKNYLGAPGQCGGKPFDPKATGAFDNICGVNLGRGTGNFAPQWMLECHNAYLKYSGETLWHPV